MLAPLGSLIAAAMTCSTTAQAQCAPNPSQAGQTTTCSGTTTGGDTVNTDNSPLVVSAGARVQNAAGNGITVSIPDTGANMARTATITVAGSVSATGGSGIAVFQGASNGQNYDYYGTTAQITVAAGGSVTGDTGITAVGTPGAYSPYSALYVSIDNSGSISGTSGVAIGPAYFTSLVNHAGGTIGAITASLGVLTNDGTIDGGALSAFTGTTVSYAYSPVTITNTGTIQANGVTATLDSFQGLITNSGTIRNTGSGAAIAGQPAYNPGGLQITNLVGGTISASGADVITGYQYSLDNSGTVTNSGAGQVASGSALTINNRAGGVISASPGGVAINGALQVSLTNQGTVNGDVYAGTLGSYGSSSTVDSTMGTINGNVTFGAGDDKLVGTVQNGMIQTGIAGAIDGGAGTNTFQIVIATDQMLASSVALPTNFSRLSLAPSYGATLTLAKGFTNLGTIYADGGMITNATTLSGVGQIIGQTGYGDTADFTNAGAIVSINSGGPIAIALNAYSSITNTGSITASGDAVSVYGTDITNSGTITAGGTAVSGFIQGTLTNSGTIRSTGGTAVSISFACTCNGGNTNSGTIDGAQVGLYLQDGTLTNTGTITSPGIAVELGSTYGTLDNAAGGVISGGTVAIGGYGGTSPSGTILNAGTINGNVNASIYFAAAGGMLNGNLTVGTGGTLVTDLVNTGPGPFAGINGTVNATGSNLVYNVAADTTTTAAAPAGFASVTYQIASGTNLTFASNSSLGGTLGLAGTGTATWDGALATTDQNGLVTQNVIAPIGSASPTNLTIINNGSIAITRTAAGALFLDAVSLTNVASFTNNGTISATDLATPAFGVASAVAGTAPVIVNNGTITGSGTYGVQLYGALAQSNGAQQVLTNTGAISSDLAAVALNGSSVIINSGTIASTGSKAIVDLSYGAGTSTITNLSGGTITGNGVAIQLTGGIVGNAGTINGDVDLGYSPYGNGYGTGSYIANGGTLNGNLNFSGWANMLVETGSGYGITGSITSTNGMSYVGHLRSSSGTVTLGGALPAGFTGEMTIASGAGTTLTLQGNVNNADLVVGGDGTIINTVTATGAVRVSPIRSAACRCSRASLLGSATRPMSARSRSTRPASTIPPWSARPASARHSPAVRASTPRRQSSRRRVPAR